MKKIEPYKNINEATLSLDNGGRFYNVLTKSNDGIISSSELGKVAGLFIDKQKMVLFLDLAISNFDVNTKEKIVDSLDVSLRSTYEKYKSHELLPSEAYDKGILSSNSIITGFPKKIDSKSDFNGVIVLPVGKSFVVMPIIDKYDVYEIRDEVSDDTFLIAHARGSIVLPEKKIKVAGVLKELKANKNEKKASKRFLEALYYLDIN
tara:strand:- start:1086 stop:1703 length:618 start_codon:yes stop_codon:yes gene_type:complete